MVTEASFEVTWERYVASWKQTDVHQKRAMWADCLDPDCVYTDPHTVAEGWSALVDYMQEFHQQSPGSYFATTSFMAHHGQSLATWEMRGADGTVHMRGTSHGRYNEGGKLVAMTGFFG